MTNRPQILVIDDDRSVVELWTEVLEHAGFQVVGMVDSVQALRRAVETPFDLVLCDVEMPQLRGPELLDRLLAKRPSQVVVLITAFGSIEAAVQSLRQGAADFISKPCEPEALVHVVRRALRERSLRREVLRLQGQLNKTTPSEAGLIAESPAMRRVLERARRVARASGPVLLQGETGTGKTSLAWYIHEQSDRAEQPFSSINASTLPEQIADAELFGVKRGAFTGAVKDRAGLFASSSGGTVFLDELTELPQSVQAKLLTVVESGQVRPVGAVDTVEVDVRLIAASNMDLGEAVTSGQFRSDLRYRLDVLTIQVPPLRARQEDLAALTSHWLEFFAAEHGRSGLRISAAGWRWLHAWHWPGNVRELMNRLQRAIVFSDGQVLGPDDLADAQLPETMPQREADSLQAQLSELAASGVSMAELEERYLQAALQAAGGNKTEAARLLGIDRRTVYRRLSD